MNPTVRQILPVIVSIVIIITVAILRNQSKTMAAVMATMPVNLPLSLWIFSNGDGVNQPAMTGFAKSLVIGMVPTMLWVVIAWLATRAGLPVGLTILVGYVIWGILIGAVILVRGGLG